MDNFFLVDFTVQGIKALDKKVSLSFYKKTIEKQPKTQNYNIKAIYGMNGSGKSAIINSVDILRSILINSSYLSNPIVQDTLREIVNKKTEKVDMSVEFIAYLGERIKHYKYAVSLGKDASEKFVLSSESYEVRNATSKNEKMDVIYSVKNGKLSLSEGFEGEFSEKIKERTANLLENTSFCETFLEKVFFEMEDKNAYIKDELVMSLMILYIFGNSIHVYVNDSDDHSNYLLKNTLMTVNDEKQMDVFIDHLIKMNCESLKVISGASDVIKKEKFAEYEEDVKHLYDFIRIFKPDLRRIQIEKKEDKNNYICDLVMNYDEYKVGAEFESTGVKKLIRLYTYLREMVRGGIVFIDEFDSNLHDVYLCALLEYLMEYGKGQLCFTTHNVGPMDVLRNNKKSIDFLTADHRICSWIKNGNYSPSKLYRSGMIEGSPFNVDSIDFIGAFGFEEDD